MKGYPLIINVVVLVVLSTYFSPVFAQSQRYPNNTESRELIRRFHQVPSNVNGDKKDFRSSLEKQRLTSFSNSWSKVFPSVAPFLGTWRGLEESISIFPSTVKNSVCILYQGENNSTSFEVASVSNRKIVTSKEFGRAYIIKQKNRLGVMGIYNNSPNMSAFEFPVPLKRLESLLSGRGQDSNKIIQQFKSSGCTTSKPNT
ncbi:hypothetical protein CLI64_08600 [Nostoc sp. CENA543]|uniref:hypothetical protein n=1 Tax=Nostoc sp. CENA543 TaxID=1869241 RepID=UPI000CA2EB37|nr:hypothetical protein [Nostoc sp. CENA543]AUT00443.1 hypothetical protein CLI64_08600 [Nostoc sp. CENA543]